MTFYEKYPQLQKKGFLAHILTETVYTTMALENQQVPKNKVAEMVRLLLSEGSSKAAQLKGDQRL